MAPAAGRGRGGGSSCRSSKRLQVIQILREKASRRTKVGEYQLQLDVATRTVEMLPTFNNSSNPATKLPFMISIGLIPSEEATKQPPFLRLQKLYSSTLPVGKTVEVAESTPDPTDDSVTAVEPELSLSPMEAPSSEEPMGYSLEICPLKETIFSKMSNTHFHHFQAENKFKYHQISKVLYCTSPDMSRLYICSSETKPFSPRY